MPQEGPDQGPNGLPSRIADLLHEWGLTLAVAESLTGGMITIRFAEAPRASEWLKGGIVAYASVVKHELLEVPPGPVVSEAAAASMARGAARLLGADVAVSATGVGGPGDQDGQPPGTVWMATYPEALGHPVLLQLEGGPREICEQVCARVAGILHARLRDAAGGRGGGGEPTRATRAAPPPKTP